MKMRELEERAPDTTKHEHGTIAKLTLSEDSATALSSWCEQNGIPCIAPDDLHCTVLFSRKPVEKLTQVNGSDMEILADISGWKLLGNCLTLELDSKPIHMLHDWMMDQGGSHDHPSFIAHTTVSYEWDPDGDVPASVPDLQLLFDQLKVQAIDPKYADKAKAE